MMAGISKALDENPKGINLMADDSITLFTQCSLQTVKPKYVRIANNLQSGKIKIPNNEEWLTIISKRINK